MTGKEVADICARHEMCDDCELAESHSTVCERIMEDMEHGTPETIHDILEQEYGGDE